METASNMTKETIDGLQGLIEINIDSADGFHSAADHIDNAAMALMFREVASERRSFANELKGYVARSGEEPERSGSWQAKVHRWWIDIRSRLSSDDLKVVLQEAERGEDKIKAVYEETLKTITGNPINDLLHEQYARVKRVHDRIRDARDLVERTD